MITWQKFLEQKQLDEGWKDTAKKIGKAAAITGAIGLGWAGATQAVKYRDKHILPAKQDTSGECRSCGGSGYSTIGMQGPMKGVQGLKCRSCGGSGNVNIKIKIRDKQKPLEPPEPIGPDDLYSTDPTRRMQAELLYGVK